MTTQKINHKQPESSRRKGKKMNKEKDAVIHALNELNDLIKTNITEDGRCLFDSVKAQVVLDFAKNEIQKSIQKNSKRD